MLPFQDGSLQITVPTFELDSDDAYELTLSHRSTSDPSFLPTLGNYLRAQAGSTSWYFPGRPSSNFNSSENTTLSFEVPKVVRGADATLSLTPSLAAAFSVRLFWSGGSLGVRVSRGGQVAFEDTLASLVGRDGHLLDLLGA